MMSTQDGPYVEQAWSLEAFRHALRALRERQGLSIADVAQRSHFPVETIEVAEAGPGRPTLPVVEAYVRACGEEPDEWEDRWRVLPAYFTVTRLGHDGRRRPLPKLALAAGIVVVAAGGGTLLLLRPASNEAARATPRHVTVQAPASTPAATETEAQASHPAMPASHPAMPAPQPRQTPSAAPVLQAATGPLVTGFGCPQGAGNGVTVDNAAAGPGWTAAADGWTGNGCDGGSLWTMNPNGKQPVSSTLTWFFAPAAGVTSCKVAVFVPAQNALGVADYAISAGTANIATVAVDQASAAGHWVTLGSYQVNGSPLDVQISPDLATLTSARTGRGHNSAIAASAASAACG